MLVTALLVHGPVLALASPARTHLPWAAARLLGLVLVVLASVAVAAAASRLDDRSCGRAPACSSPGVRGRGAAALVGHGAFHWEQTRPLTPQEIETRSSQGTTGMTVTEPAPTPVSSADAAAERRRRRMAVALGVLSVPLAVVAAGYLTWSADDEQAVAPPITGTTLPASPGSSAALVPDGDYGPLCAAILGSADLASPPQLDAVYRVVLDADLASWITVAPPDFRPTLRRLETEGWPRQVVGAAPDIATLEQSAKDRLPPAFASDLLAVSLLLATECPSP